MDNYSSRAAAYIFFCSVFLAINCAPSLAQSCARSLTFNRNQKSFGTCRDLGSLGASLAWSLFPENNTLEVAFSASAPSASGWVGWGINLGPAPVMNGSDVLVAFSASNGSNLLQYKLTETTLSGTLPSCSPVDLTVLDRAVEISGSFMKIFAVLQLQPNQTVLNHVWNRGPGITAFKPQPHSPTDQGILKVDMASGTVATVQAPYQRLKNRHGIINVVGWGILLPLGVIAARYLRPFEVADPAWFYIHVFCQSSGYIIGVAGWATGLRLGSYSKGVVYHTHRNIGISVFSFATLQVLSLLMRPQKDHKVRTYWNVFHHTLGYTTIILAIVNIFEGLHILQPKSSWRNAYLGILIALGAVSLILEVITWVAYFHRSKKSSDPVKAAGQSTVTNGFHNGSRNGNYNGNAHSSSKRLSP
ncbi:hypothetical protein O6H91_04G019000 [Diphasiastrum complanatum]|uniref:Uncharacterized protein n=1 Tax=Diphasiastrum complanatum TaxID=34168 RepID=A0ACC2DUL8_DIPCM|nr:hypothetical protein O6H91_Y379900 [Diphasiastrum complanatum]KAJ7557970.1 hypothetical protein O6H91_04G019000 [Diphasiastrum complanatum]